MKIICNTCNHEEYVGADNPNQLRFCPVCGCMMRFIR
jgi:hypothetical protein